MSRQWGCYSCIVVQNTRFLFLVEGFVLCFCAALKVRMLVDYPVSFGAKIYFESPCPCLWFSWPCFSALSLRREEWCLSLHSLAAIYLFVRWRIHPIAMLCLENSSTVFKKGGNVVLLTAAVFEAVVGIEGQMFGTFLASAGLLLQRRHRSLCFS